MPKSRKEINAPFALCASSLPMGVKTDLFPLVSEACRPHVELMNYILAIFLPPLSILLTGRPFLSIIVFLLWIPALFFSGGLTHPMFILLAWALIFHAREDRRQRY